MKQIVYWVLFIIVVLISFIVEIWVTDNIGRTYPCKIVGLSNFVHVPGHILSFYSPGTYADISVIIGDHLTLNKTLYHMYCGYSSKLDPDICYLNREVNQELVCIRFDYDNWTIRTDGNFYSIIPSMIVILIILLFWRMDDILTPAEQIQTNNAST
jgi:hypothetical protein